MRPTFRIKHLLCLMALAGGILQLFVWEPWEEPRYKRRTIAAVRQVEERLAIELSDVNSAPWAGVYCLEGDLNDATLTIAPNAGWVMERHYGGGCFVHTDYNFGRCALEHDAIRLIPWMTIPEVPSVLLLTLLPFLASPRGMVGWVLLAAFELLAIFSLFGLYDSVRFKWCWRIVGGIVFAGYLAYLVEMVGSGQWISDGRRSSATVVNAVIGLIVFGYPGFMYAVFGRFTLRAESIPDHCHKDKLLDADDTDPATKAR